MKDIQIIYFSFDWQLPTLSLKKKQENCPNMPKETKYICKKQDKLPRNTERIKWLHNWDIVSIEKHLKNSNNLLLDLTIWPTNLNYFLITPHSHWTLPNVVYVTFKTATGSASSKQKKRHTRNFSVLLYPSIYLHLILYILQLNLICLPV